MKNPRPIAHPLLALGIAAALLFAAATARGARVDPHPFPRSGIVPAFALPCLERSAA